VDAARVLDDHDRVGDLLERDEALSALAGYAEEARRGDSRFVLIAGEAGIGKTRLVEEVPRHVTDARWLRGACDGAFTPEPLAPLFDVAGQVGGALEQSCVAGDVPRDRMFRALLAELTQSDVLTALVIEDVHWADEATLDLVRFLVRRLRQAKVLVLLTFRDDGLGDDHPLRTTIGELAAERSIRRVTLPPLSPDAVRRLADGSGLSTDALYELTGGNPFLVTEVIDAGTDEVPPSVREALLARMSKLSVKARRVLEAAAVIGIKVDVNLLRRVAVDDVRSLDECLLAGALVSERDTFRFRHELARRAVEESIPAHRSAELHETVLAALLASQDVDAARAAHHADRAGDGDVVLKYAPIAAERASSLGAHMEAMALYECAVRYAGVLDVRDRAELYGRLADEAKFIDRWPQSLAAREVALSLWTEAGDATRIGGALTRLAVAYWRLCRVEDSDAAAARAVEVLEPLGPSAELALAYTTLANTFGEGDVDAGRAMAETALAMAEQFGADDVTGRALMTLAGFHLMRGHEPFELYEQAREVGLRGGDETIVGAAYANWHEAAARTRRFAIAQQVFDEGLVYVQDHEIDTYQSCLFAWHAFALESQGRYDEALALLLDVLGKRHVSPVNRLFSMPILARIRARTGDAEAKAALDEALELTSTGGDRTMELEVALTEAELAWLDDRNDDATSALTRAVTLLPYTEPWTQAWVVSWAHRLGLDVEVRSPLPGPYRLAAAGELRASADAWLALGCPYDAALTLIDAGDEASLRDAARLFDSIGATAAMSIVQNRLRETGARRVPRGRRATTRADAFGLTTREREVLGYLCAGMTNTEIGKEMVIAPKTVDHHVASVLMKMGVESRRDAARKASAAGVVPVEI